MHRILRKDNKSIRKVSLTANNSTRGKIRIPNNVFKLIGEDYRNVNKHARKRRIKMNKYQVSAIQLRELSYVYTRREVSRSTRFSLKIRKHPKTKIKIKLKNFKIILFEYLQLVLLENLGKSRTRLSFLPLELINFVIYPYLEAMIRFIRWANLTLPIGQYSILPQMINQIIQNKQL